MPNKTAAALILAAGLSSRSGTQNKLLAKQNGKTVLETTLDGVRASIISHIYIVTGHMESPLESLTPADVHIIKNHTYKDGIGTSIAAGIKALPPYISLVFICLADMPFVKESTYKALLIAAHKTASKDIFIPTYKGKRGNPVLWRQSQFHELALLNADIGGRSIILNHEDTIAEVPVIDQGILIDLDTPEALNQYRFTE
ncbi:nucleotidyltransferase family protein [Kordiimonas pumila]|uniref:NTP transferase domain-containing protein n=1 Tax=Kordiimonas pumila TaxID=2161677 RepID=A0ABV7D335_9PROT|nr:nucleotidyltransferase family protein [Kordiimonas pumila]